MRPVGSYVFRPGFRFRNPPRYSIGDRRHNIAPDCNSDAEHFGAGVDFDKFFLFLFIRDFEFFLLGQL